MLVQARGDSMWQQQNLGGRVRMPGRLRVWMCRWWQQQQQQQWCLDGRSEQQIPIKNEIGAPTSTIWAACDIHSHRFCYAFGNADTHMKRSTIVFVWFRISFVARRGGEWCDRLRAIVVGVVGMQMRRPISDSPSLTLSQTHTHIAEWCLRAHLIYPPYAVTWKWLFWFISLRMIQLCQSTISIYSGILYSLCLLTRLSAIYEMPRFASMKKAFMQKHKRVSGIRSRAGRSSLALQLHDFPCSLFHLKFSIKQPLCGIFLAPMWSPTRLLDFAYFLSTERKITKWFGTNSRFINSAQVSRAPQSHGFESSGQSWLNSQRAACAWLYGSFHFAARNNGHSLRATWKLLNVCVRVCVCVVLWRCY